jgi:hypothetical protein
MKTSWIMGIMMVYLLILSLEMIATGGTVLGASASYQVDSANYTFAQGAGKLVAPEISNSSNVIAQAWSAISNIGPYLNIAIAILLLWSPTLFAGNMIWVWWFVCFPTCVGMVFSIISIARGVPSR